MVISSTHIKFTISILHTVVKSSLESQDGDRLCELKAIYSPKGGGDNLATSSRLTL